MLSPDDTHVFIVVSERPVGVKSTIVPNYVTEAGYTEDIPARSNVGDTQDRRLLAILNLKTGKTVWADASFAPPVPEEEKPAAAGSDRHRIRKPGRKAEREVRWSMPVVSADGKLTVASVRSADNKDRWFVTVDPESGKTRVIDVLHDEAWVREARVRWLDHRVPARQPAHLVSVRARRLDASLHAGRRRGERQAGSGHGRQVGSDIGRDFAATARRST